MKCKSSHCFLPMWLKPTTVKSIEVSNVMPIFSSMFFHPLYIYTGYTIAPVNSESQNLNSQ